MWRNKDVLQPKDSTTAALFYARALATAEHRLETNQSSTSQYNLIASYLALRAFRILATVSETPLLETERLKRIAIWHLELLERVRLNGLETIQNESAELTSHRPILAIMYRKNWAQLLLENNRVKQLEGMRRFRQSIESEQDATSLLADINLRREELIASANSVAGRIEQPTSQRPEVRELVKKQTSESEEFVRNNNPSNSAKLDSDVRYLKQLWGF